MPKHWLPTKITFISDRCHCSHVAMTPGIYECDSKDFKNTWQVIKISLIHKLKCDVLVTPPRATIDKAHFEGPLPLNGPLHLNTSFSIHWTPKINFQYILKISSQYLHNYLPSQNQLLTKKFQWCHMRGRVFHITDCSKVCFRLTTKEISKLHMTWPLWVESTKYLWLSSQRESVCTSWNHINNCHNWDTSLPYYFSRNYNIHKVLGSKG